jgi:hypothetical protein
MRRKVPADAGRPVVVNRAAPNNSGVFRVSFSYTVNMGNYESSRIEAAVERDLYPGEQFDAAMIYEYQRCRSFVEEAVLKLEADHGRKPRR